MQREKNPILDIDKDTTQRKMDSNHLSVTNLAVRKLLCPIRQQYKNETADNDEVEDNADVDDNDDDSDSDGTDDDDDDDYDDDHAAEKLSPPQ